MIFASTVTKVLKKAIAKLNICRENFHDSFKIRESCETFSRLTFVIYGM